MRAVAHRAPPDDPRIAELERALAKERRISAALIDRVERSTDLQGGAFQLFETAIALEAKVRDRTGDLARALDTLAATNAELARSQAEAEGARRRLVDAIESSNEGLAIFDAEDRLVLCNATYLGLWPRVAERIRPGVTFSAIVEMVGEEGITLGAMAAPGRWISERMQQHAVAEGGHVHALADGRWVQINELRTSDGGIVGVYTDITETKAEDARARADELARRSVLLQTTLDSIHAGVAVYDRDRALVAWNDPLRSVLRLPDDVRAAIDPHARLGQHCTVDDPVFADCPTFAWPQEGAADVVRQPALADGRTLEIRRRAMPGGGVVVSFADITAERAAERSLREANDLLEARVAARTAEAGRAREAAEEANRSKTRFLAAASHDLLQPLNAARLFTAALAERRLALPTRALVQQTSAALDSVEDLLEALLEISRMDAGAIVPERVDFSLRHLLAALRSEFAPFARQRGLTLAFDECDAVVRSDPRLVRRILQNLISNALRYSGVGGVSVKCMVAGETVSISVADTGPGIAAEHHDLIFEEFRRLDVPGRERGMGLGLAIVRRAAAMLAHPLTLVSAPGEGSIFGLVLPRGEPTAMADPAPARRIGRNAKPRVLVIDNEPAILNAMEALLSGWGCVVTLAAGADAAHRQAAASPPDLMLIDYHLDGTTGDRLAAALLAKMGRAVPTAIVTADRTPALRETLGTQGFAVLTKPVKPAQLRALMGKLVG